ncbi:ABC transporter permease [Butyrivibrio sp. MC2013]|uniref:ABC transporter permease n=1 Tax=Butyrivibrio sp. MC2013 TaxID=1280686 RepID=UPI00040FA8E5|nr:ABC transporter permease [Butyrivibrio sp. MC2013]
MNISLINVRAIFIKECKDAIKNKSIIFMLVMFPVFTYLFYEIVDKETIAYVLPNFITMHLIMSPILCMASILGEEKEKGTLRVLLYANVTSLEYVVGIGIFVLGIIWSSSLLYIPVLRFDINQLLLFLGVSFWVSLCSMIIGAVIGTIVKNQISVGPYAAPVAIALGMMPMLAMINGSVMKVSRFFYSQIVFNIVSNPDYHLTKVDIIVSLINLSSMLVIFAISYRKNDVL